MLRNLRYSARSFTRRPGLALALLFTIALGVAGIVSVRGFVRGFTKPWFPMGSLDRLVAVFGGDAQGEAGPLSEQQYLYAGSRHDLFQWLGAARVSPGSIVVAGQTAFVPVAAVTPNVAGAFGLSLDKGVVISHRLWQGEFEGRPTLAGRRFESMASPLVSAELRRTGWREYIATARLTSGCLCGREHRSGPR